MLTNHALVGSRVVDVLVTGGLNGLSKKVALLHHAALHNCCLVLTLVGQNLRGFAAVSVVGVGW